MWSPANTPHADKQTLLRISPPLLFLVVMGRASLSLSSVQQDPPDLERGRAIYTQQSRSCHGDQGEGNGPEAEALPVPPPNCRHLRSILQSDEDLLKAIEHGQIFSPMHGWQGRLADEALQDVLAYIRLLPHRGP